jgi:hypothetical protein
MNIPHWWRNPLVWLAAIVAGVYLFFTLLGWYYRFPIAG